MDRALAITITLLMEGILKTNGIQKLRVAFAKVPTPLAGLALGFAALGNLLAPWNAAFLVACDVISGLLATLIAMKALICPGLIRDDLNNSIAASVLGTLFMSIMLLSSSSAASAYVAALIIWALAVLGHCALIVWFTARFMRTFELREVFPTYFICYVGVIVVSVTSPTFGSRALGMAFFWFGFICYVALFALVTVRYAKHEVPEAARPLFCIYAAPMSLSLVGYLSVGSTPSTAFVIILLVLAQALYLFVLFHLPKFLKLRFYPSFSAMTFPFVISATALSQGFSFLLSTGELSAFHQAISMVGECLVGLETLIAVALVLFVSAHYLRFMAHEATGSKPMETAEERAADERFEEWFED